MPQYLYVDQGEYFITTDSKTTLVTTGMTDCIAMAFVDKNDKACRLLVHLDGFILNSEENATANLKMIKEKFIFQTKSQDFDIYIFGGQKQFRNYKILRPVLDALDMQTDNITDVNELCGQLGSARLFSPSNVCYNDLSC